MKIAITSPAGKVDNFKLSKGVSFLKSKGYEIVIGETVGSQEFWTAGSAELRAAELERFWCDASIDVVWAARGGFGCAHLLELMDWSRMKAFNKVLCGHSDISILHLAFLSKGIKRTVSSAMPAVEFAEDVIDDLTVTSTIDLLSEPSAHKQDFLELCTPLKAGRATGPLVPVTLSVLCSLLGTDYLPELGGSILVLEDVNEAPYRIDAYLNQLNLSGIISSLGGLVFGDFSNCGEQDELSYIFGKYSKLVNGPVLSGLQFGHCLPRLSLPVGYNVELLVSENKALL